MAQNNNGKCPICSGERESPSDNEWFPFCCERCKMVDLYHWLNEEYYIPGDPLPQSEEGEEF